MKPPLRKALDGLQRAVAARAKLADADLEPFEEPEPCRVMSSPGGRWVLAPTRRDALAYRIAHPGEAVFLAEEVRRVGDDLVGLSPEERQEWLRDVIKVKSVIPGATVEWVREPEKPRKP